MNEPIIEPWLIYLIGIAPNVRDALILILASFVAITIWLFICAAIDESFKYSCSAVVSFCIALAICITLALIPDREWIVATILANETTPENIERIIDAGIDVKEAFKQDLIEVLTGFDVDAVTLSGKTPTE